MIYALPGGRPVRTISHPAAVSAVMFAGAGHDLATGSIDGTVLVARDEGAPIGLPRFSERVDSAGFLPDGRVVATAGHQLRVYDADRNAVLGELAIPTRAGYLRASPDSRRLVIMAALCKPCFATRPSDQTAG